MAAVFNGASSKVRASSAKLGAATNLKSTSSDWPPVLLLDRDFIGLVVLLKEPGDARFAVCLDLHLDLECLSVSRLALRFLSLPLSDLCGD